MDSCIQPSLPAPCRYPLPHGNPYAPATRRWRRIVTLRGVAIALIVARHRDGRINFDASVFQSLYAVEFGVVAIGEVLARPFAVICCQALFIGAILPMSQSLVIAQAAAK